MSDESNSNQVNEVLAKENDDTTTSEQQQPQVQPNLQEDESKSTKSDVKSPSSSSISSSSSSSAVSNTSNQPANQADEFENLQRAVSILGKAKQLDEIKRYDEALKLYRQGVDMLLEELIVRQGTDQSRNYLRGKCNDFMNRIDQLKMIIQIENANKANKENQAANA